MRNGFIVFGAAVVAVFFSAFTGGQTFLELTHVLPEESALALGFLLSLVVMYGYKDEPTPTSLFEH